MRLFLIMRLVCLAVLLAPCLQGQTESKTLDRIAREQQNIRLRLERILDKMERLVKRNELDGRQHTADLIRRARAEIDNRGLVKRIEDLDVKIRASQLTVEGEQAAVLKDLEDIFAILQDRTDMERLEDLINSYTEGLRKIGTYLEDQNKILEETRRLAYDEKTLMSSTREQIDELKEAQNSLNAEVEQAAEKTNLEEVWSTAEALEDLADQEESLAKETASQGPELNEEKAGDLASKQEKVQEKLGALQERMEGMQKAEPGSSGEALQRPEMQEALRESMERAKEADKEMAAASESLKEEKPTEAAERQEKAAQALRAAAEQLSQAGRSAHSEERREQMELGERQDDLRREMEEVRDKLKRLENLDKERSFQNSENVEQSEEVLGEMEAARDQLTKGNPDSAKPHQSKAKEGLEQLSQALEEKQAQMPQDGSEENGSRASAESQTQEYQDLAERQKALEERVRELMRRMRELPDQSPVRDMSNAADNMAGASDELAAEEGGAAERDEEEAAKHLEKAKKAMEQEETKYQNIRQQEVLFRVQQALEKLKSEQDKINMDTAEFDLGRGEEGRLTRPQRRTLLKMTEREEGVREKNVEVTQKIEEDSSTVFSWVLERNTDDLDEVIEYFRKRESGPVVQLIQEDISSRYGELIDTLKLEMKRRMEEAAKADEEGEQQQPQDGSQPERNPLIPPVAELLMIKKMEENALRSLEEFLRLHPEVMREGAGPMEARLLERLGHRHSNITELFDKMLERAAAQQGGGTATGEGN